MALPNPPSTVPGPWSTWRTPVFERGVKHCVLPDHLITDRITIWTALSRQRREGHGPQPVAKQLLAASYPKPLLNLAMSRCLGPHNQFQTILHYLTDQANLLALNREHI